MKLALYIVFVLVASLVIASLDAFPDPPAVNPHALDLKVTGARDLPNACDDQRALGISPCGVLPFPSRRADFTGMVTPNRLGDQMAVVRHAADPSPQQLSNSHSGVELTAPASWPAPVTDDFSGLGKGQQ